MNGKAESSDLLRLLHRETLNQVSVLQSLVQGDFLGSVTVAELKRLGDVGIGTFHALDGELIMLDGVVYQARGDGRVVIAPDDATVPFADVTFIDDEIPFAPVCPCDLEGLRSQLDAVVARENPNLFYMAVLSCRLDELTVRSARPQPQNQSPLAEVMKTAQVAFTYAPIAGTLVALYCPQFMSSLNMPGWHFHFVSDDGTRGGHVLRLRLREGRGNLDQTRSFNMILPDADTAFARQDLTRDQSRAIAAVEGGTPGRAKARRAPKST